MRAVTLEIPFWATAAGWRPIQIDQDTIWPVISTEGIWMPK